MLKGNLLSLFFILYSLFFDLLSLILLLASWFLALTKLSREKHLPETKKKLPLQSGLNKGLLKSLS